MRPFWRSTVTFYASTLLLLVAQNDMTAKSAMVLAEAKKFLVSPQMYHIGSNFPKLG